LGELRGRIYRSATSVPRIAHYAMPAQDRNKKTRVAILGGGPAALATAFELTATPELQAQHEVTIYQPGWRLGGKCASGRNRDLGSRIEEHGLHVWFGCYDNAFWIMRRCYAELGRDKRTHPLPTWRHAFKPCHQVAVWDRGEEWDPHVLNFPPTPGEPGTERQREFIEVLREVLGWIDRRMRQLVVDDPALAGAVADAPIPAAPVLEAACRDVAVPVERPEHLGVTLLFEAAARFAERHVEGALRGVASAADDVARYVHLLAEFNRWVADHLVDALPDHAELRFFARTVDVVMAALKGILEDGLLFEGFDAINDVELSKWLEDHGASIDRDNPENNSVFLRGVYDGSFAFEEGDPRRPNMAAGRALQGAIRCLFHYNGAVLWRMQAGMGDAVIAPLYQVLRRRKVRFAFFHAVEDVRPSADGARVERISIVPQVAVRDGRYDPLVDVDYAGKPLECWPDRPRYDQLVGGRSTRVRAADFEHVIDPLAVEERVTLVAGKDFDVAVLAVPPPVQEQVCAGLRAANRRYARMLDGVHTVVTQAAQLWLDRTPRELGWRWDSNSLMSMYVEPVDTYCDMSHLLVGEQWPRRFDVRHIAYFCGVIQHEQVKHPQAAAASVHRQTREFLERDAGRFWPRAAVAGEVADGAGFDWARLIAPADAVGPERLMSQYLRTNHEPAEQYVLTLAGTVDSRLSPGDRCFENLVLAGDWTRNGFDAGCVEAAMTSGMLAAQAICPSAAADGIAGLNGPTGFPNAPADVGDGGGSPFGWLGRFAGQAAGDVLGAVEWLGRRLRLG
jgi:uncharacterized protein with NAD-binding domain and iron-sulfur cluster